MQGVHHVIAGETLQRLLNAAGANVKTDGWFGTATEKAVREFQAAATPPLVAVPRMRGDEPRYNQSSWSKRHCSPHARG